MKIETYNTICDVPDIPYVKEFKDLFHDLEKTNPCRQKYHLLVEVDDLHSFVNTDLISTYLHTTS